MVLHQQANRNKCLNWGFAWQRAQEYSKSQHSNPFTVGKLFINSVDKTNIHRLQVVSYFSKQQWSKQRREVSLHAQPHILLTLNLSVAHNNTQPVMRVATGYIPWYAMKRIKWMGLTNTHPRLVLTSPKHSFHWNLTMKQTYQQSIKNLGELRVYLFQVDHSLFIDGLKKIHCFWSDLP